MASPLIEGPRACTKAELPEAIALVDRVMRGGTGQSFLIDYPLVYLDENLENIRILKVDGEVASEVPFLSRPVEIGGCRFTIGVISPTATAPEHRRKGYGLRCLNSCIEKMTRMDIDLSVLWTLAETFPFYEKGNYQAVRPQCCTYRCRREDSALFADHGRKIVRYDPRTRRYVEDIRAMHGCEITGVVRTAEQYPPLLDLPKMKTLVALRRGESEAYLIVSRAANKPGLVEAGGEPPGVETLVHHALSELAEGEHLFAYEYLTPTVLGDLLRRKKPGRSQPTAGNMMVRINNVRRFMERIAPWVEEGGAGADRRFSLAVADAGELIGFEFCSGRLALGSAKFETHVELSVRELTSIVFGPHPERPVATPEVLKDLFPFYFPIWMMDHS